MTNNNKILTVSYGTFSCTLEGFDDSFDTMKSIAEYFRDLAADDRYFGAEPPQPDAELLAKIAEGEMARRVEAQEHEGRILLKAHDTVEAQTAAPAPLKKTVPEAEHLHPEVDTLSDVADDLEDTEVLASKDDDVEMAESISQEVEESAAAFFADSPSADDVPEENEGSEEITVEAFTSYIPAVAAGEAEASVEEEMLDPLTEHAAFEDATEAEKFEEETFAQKEPVEPEAEVALQDEPVGGEAEKEAFDTTEESDPVGETAAEDVAVGEAADFEDQNSEPEIVSEVESDEADAVNEEFASEETIGEIEEPVETPVAETQVESEDNLPPQTEAEAEEDLILEPEEPAATALFSGETFADKLQRIRDVVSRRDEDDSEEDFEEIPETSTQMGDFATMPTPQDLLEAESVENRTAADAAIDIENALASDDDLVGDEAQDESDDLDRMLDRIEAGEFGDLTSDDLGEVSKEETGTVEDNIFDETTAEDDEASKEEVAVDGRILKVDRSALDAALQSGELEEYEDDTLIGAAELNDEAEQDLRRELAEAESFAETREEEKPSARQSLPEIDESDGNGVSRLMAEAEQHMDEPEGKTRRSAFAHLRAAVAARFADRSMEANDAQAEEEEAKAYRSDLAEVVKPRRPGSEPESEAPSERLSTERPSPLKLVAEQRIDPKDKADVAPRRVAAAPVEELILDEDSGFANYADERGANSLTEVLEAAAAYLCHVEGVEQFSRPQLMARVKQADCGEFTREDGLRAFGQLLRTGKIEKVKGGRFVASEAIGFKPGHRQAG